MTNIFDLLLFVSSTTAVTFELFELPSHTYPQALCNDGTEAGYYHDTDLSKLDKVHVHLQGGNLCDSDVDCLARCDRNHDGEVDNSLCTASSRQTIDVNGGLFADDEENPLRDYWHVNVPYCSSDTWAGTGKSHETGYFFHGKNIFRNVMNSLSHHFNLFDASEFVLSGSSAGAFGVGLNCDDVAEWLHANNPSMKVRCIADAPDFIPWWVHSDNCPRRAEGYQQFVNSFWARDADHSCQQFAHKPSNNVSDPDELCGILSQSLSFVSTDIFILVSLRDTLISRDYGCPESGLEEEVILPWMSGMHSLIESFTSSMDRVGWFVPSCNIHVIYSKGVTIKVEDLNTGIQYNPYTALQSWMNGAKVHALDSLEEENMTCP